jgi:hypothetical protein
MNLLVGISRSKTRISLSTRYTRITGTHYLEQAFSSMSPQKVEHTCRRMSHRQHLELCHIDETNILICHIGKTIILICHIGKTKYFNMSHSQIESLDGMVS